MITYKKRLELAASFGADPYGRFVIELIHDDENGTTLDVVISDECEESEHDEILQLAIATLEDFTLIGLTPELAYAALMRQRICESLKESARAETPRAKKELH